MEVVIGAYGLYCWVSSGLTLCGQMQAFEMSTIRAKGRPRTR